jgi:hypothetical protein
VLQLDPSAVKGLWKVAVSSYSNALEFLKNRCSVLSSGLFPARAMVLPIANALREDERQRQSLESDIVRWFWAATFQQVYAQATNTQAVADAKALRAWNTNSGAVPKDVREFKLETDSLQDQRRRNEMLVRGIACLLAKHNARDWIQSDKRISDKPETETIDFHHVFASKYPENIGIDDGDLVANLSPLFASSNQSLRDQPPSIVTAREDVSSSAIESHLVDLTLFKEGQWNNFLDARSKQLKGLISEVVG